MKKVLSILLVLAMVFAFAACGGKKVKLQIGQVITSAHGNKCFTVTTAVVEGDKVVKTYIDEYQYMNGAGVAAAPNAADKNGLGSYLLTENVLASKRESDAYYTDNLKKKALATMDYAENLDAIQAFCEGKTISEIENGVDAVTGCTLRDASNYIKAVAAAAKEAYSSAPTEYSYKGDSINLKLNRVNAAAYDNECFIVAAALTDGEKIVLSYIDEFRYMPADGSGVSAVPNSDVFKAYVKDGYVLGSARASNAYYTDILKVNSTASADYAENLDIIQNYVNGKSVAELGKGVDSIEDCSLADVSCYIDAILKAAK